MEIYKSSPENAYLRIYVEGVLTDAESEVTATLFGDEEPVELEVDKVSDIEGTYKTTIPAMYTSEEGDIFIQWTFDDTVKTDVFTIVTPYIDTYTLLSLCPVGTTWEEAKYAEQYARLKIEAATGQSFGNQNKSVNLKGRGTDVLVSTERIISFNSLTENNVLVIDSEINIFGENIKVSDTNFGLCVDRTSSIVDYRQTGIRDRGGIFKESYDYLVEGSFGWESVPVEVAAASQELISDYWCSDNQYRESYVKRIKSGDWSVDFDSGVFAGTGNSYVDSLLSDYYIINMVVV